MIVPPARFHGCNVSSLENGGKPSTILHNCANIIVLILKKSKRKPKIPPLQVLENEKYGAHR
jgi:hypothetical protein